MTHLEVAKKIKDNGYRCMGDLEINCHICPFLNNIGKIEYCLAHHKGFMQPSIIDEYINNKSITPMIEKLKQNERIYAFLTVEEKKFLNSINKLKNTIAYVNDAWVGSVRLTYDDSLVYRLKLDYNEKNTYVTLDGITLNDLDYAYCIYKNEHRDIDSCYIPCTGGLKVGYVYFHSKDKANLYLKGLKGEKLQVLDNLFNTLFVNEPLDKIDWTIPFESIRVKPAEAPYRELDLDMKTRNAIGFSDGEHYLDLDSTLSHPDFIGFIYEHSPLLSTEIIKTELFQNKFRRVFPLKAVFVK